MPAQNQNVYMRFVGQDVGASRTIEQVRSRVDQMPSAFGRSAAAMSALGNASGQMGGRVADLGGKFTDLALLVSTGGPLGIAIGGVTAAITLGVSVWQSWTAEEVAAENAARSLNAVFRESMTRTAEYTKHISDLEKEIRNLGKTQGQIQREDLAETIDLQEVGIDQLEKEIAALREKAAVSRANAEAAKNMQTGLDKLIGAGSRAIDFHEQQAEMLDKQADQMDAALIRSIDMQNMREKEIELSRRKEAAERRVAEQARLAAELERERQEMAKARGEALAGMDEAIVLSAGATTSKLRELDNSIFADRMNHIDQFVAARDEARQRTLQLHEQASLRQAEIDANYQRAHQEVMLGIGAAAGNAFASIITDSENAGKHMIKAVVEAARSAVIAYASAGAAASAAANAGIPGIGWIAAIAGAGAVFSAISAFVDQIPTASRGGVVPGMDVGRDNTLMLARGGERYFSPEHNERMVRALEQGGGGGGIHIHEHNVISSTTAELAKKASELSRLQRRMQLLGLA